jgi:hypothetical protein
MPKTIRFHEPRYHNAYGYFEKDSVYTDVPDDYDLASSDEEITEAEITRLDNVRTKPYHSLVTAGITKKVVDAKQPRAKRQSSLGRVPAEDGKGAAKKPATRQAG